MKSNEELNMDNLIQMNRQRFRKIFAQHLPKEGKLPPSEFLKLCKTVKIFPDLLSSMDLKRILSSYSAGISYKGFETLLKTIADTSFNTKAPLSDKLRMLLIHIRNALKMHYQVNIVFHARKREDSSKKTIRKGFLMGEEKKTPLINNFVKTEGTFSSRKLSKSPLSINLSNPGTPRKLFTSSFQSDVSDVKNVIGTFKHFQQQYRTMPVPPRNQLVIQKQRDYISSLRSSLFEARMVKSMIFNAWKGIIFK